MQRKVILIILVIGSLFLAFGVWRVLANRGAKDGELRVDAQVVSTVYLDNSVIGKTPYRGKVKLGEYTLRLVPEVSGEAVSTWQGKVKVGGNLLTYVNATLGEGELVTAVDVLWLERITSKQAEIAVTTAPDGATVYLNNEAKGLTPTTLSNINSSDYTLVISSPGFTSRTMQIHTTGGYRLIVTSKLALGDSGVATTEDKDKQTGEVNVTPTQGMKVSGTPKPTMKTTLAKPYVIISDTPTGFLRVRSEASTVGEEVARVEPGESYPLVSRENGWYEIKYEGEKTGWISGQYAQKVD